MKILKQFLKEEAKEKAHSSIKKTLKKADSGKQYSKEHHKKMHKHHSELAEHHEKLADHHKKIMKGLTEKSPKVKKFIEKRMHEMKEGKMHSRVKHTGPKVTNPKQGIAISLSELRAKGAKIPKNKK